MLGNIFILGDSYSTFDGYIPDGFASYYGKDGPKYVTKIEGAIPDDNDVTDVTHTWWYNLTKENGTLLQNCSWSGTTICNTGYDGCDNSKISFSARFERLVEEGFFKENKPDTIFLFGGTNDSWSDAPIGNPIESGWTKEDLYNVLPGFSYLISILTKNLENTKIYCLINDEIKEEIKTFYRRICAKHKIDVIEICNVEKRYGHPTKKGMANIKEIILDYIKTK